MYGYQNNILKSEKISKDESTGKDMISETTYLLKL